MKNRLKWVDDLCFLAETASGHAIVLDAATDKGGRNRGVRPMEMLLLGAAGCMSFDVMSMMKKAKEDVRDVWVDMDTERADDFPKVFTGIHFHFVFTGKDLKVSTIERAIKLSSEKYCSASIMLGKTAKMNYTYEIRDVE